MKQYMEPKINVLVLVDEDILTASDGITLSSQNDCDYMSWDQITFS